MNRLFCNEGHLERGKINNIYGIITSSGQYQSILEDSKYYPNSYQPPKQGEDEDELKAWENAKRLAAILCIAIQEYGEEPDGNINMNNRDENILKKGDNECRQQVIDFIERQQDIEGENIENDIDTRGNFRSKNTEVEKKKGAISIGGNTFFYDHT